MMAVSPGVHAMHRTVVLLVGSCLSLAAVHPRLLGEEDPRPRPLPPVVFEGFGLAGFDGQDSIAAALRQVDAGRRQEAESEASLAGLMIRGIDVRGPNGRDTLAPVLAELQSRIDRFDVAAGLRAEQDKIAEGPSQWVGRIGLSSDREDGSERLELRTTLGRRNDGGILGVEVGPRLERRLRRGATFFIDGKAQAQAARSAETGWWSLPGTATDGSSTVGVAARTGFVR
jgi:hypothetical protein